MEKIIPIILNFDDSVSAYQSIVKRVDNCIDLRSIAESLRVCCGESEFAVLREKIVQLRSNIRQPWLAFLGSGDFHHITSILIDTLSFNTLNAANEAGFTLVLIDNHPDWFKRPKYHCGTWISRVLENPKCSGVIIVGPGNRSDLSVFSFFSAPRKDLISGRLKFYPQELESVKVPFWGTELGFIPLTKCAIAERLTEIAQVLEEQPVYLSIDLDCLSSAEMWSDWDQGCIRIEELIDGLYPLCKKVKCLGVDIVGDHAKEQLSNFCKRLSAGRLFERKSANQGDLRGKNEKINSMLLDFFQSVLG